MCTDINFLDNPLHSNTINSQICANGATKGGDSGKFVCIETTVRSVLLNQLLMPYIVLDTFAIQ